MDGLSADELIKRSHHATVRVAEAARIYVEVVDSGRNADSALKRLRELLELEEAADRATRRALRLPEEFR